MGREDLQLSANQAGAKRGRGRPAGTKDTLVPYMDELERRFRTRTALPYLKQEVVALYRWGQDRRAWLKAEYGLKTHKSKSSIKGRLTERFNGPDGYRMARAHRIPRRHWPELADPN